MDENKNVFEAGKTAYHCNKCGTNMLLYPEQPKRCLCGSTDLIVIDNREVHVVIGIYGGVLQDTELFIEDDKATEREKKLCEEYEVPFDKEERQNYYDSNGEHTIHHLIVKLQ